MGKVHLKVHVVAHREAAGGRWVAGSPELDVWSSGETPQEALVRTGEALALFLATAAEMGTAMALLAESGIKVYSDPSQVPPDNVLDRVRNAIRGDSFPVELTIPVPPEHQAAAQ
jgi:predicted RNase H-like HicB family nuclease